MEPRVLVGASQLGWVTTLTQWVSEHGGAQLVGQALIPDDVHGADFDLLVLDGWSSLLSRRLVDRVQGGGAAVLVLVNSDRPEAESNRLHDLGVSLSLPASASPEQIIGRATEVAAVRRFTDEDEPPSSEPASGDTEEAEHRLVVLLGQDGVTEVAANLATVFGKLGRSTLLADFNTVNPSIAQRLGLPIVPNLLTASDEVRHGRFGEASVVPHSAGFVVVPGLANPREWDELTSVEAGELVSAFRDEFSVTFAAVHPMLEDLAPLSGLEGRFDVSRRLVELADEMLMVAAGSPVGLVRALSTIADIRSITATPIHVVVNRMPQDRFLRAEWTRELTRTFNPVSLTFLPFDRGLSKASWDARLADGGPFAREIRRFTSELVGAWAA